ncbi:MAG: cytochrome c6 [Acidobacteriota bacterium]|jgi:cbb3-type cytochrome c oxidase subunit III|nr:cytochrome c6 [Acidobacteriota bacterium]MDT7777902.1 cytochrome c6 [Acidobacteriota bacterium]
MKRMKAFVFCAGVFIFLASNVGISTTAETKRGKAAVIERGHGVYTENCGRCHGADGQGHTRTGEMVEAPDLSDASWQRSRSASRMLASVTNGRGQMPAFKKKLSRQDIAAAVAYVRTLKR